MKCVKDHTYFLNSYGFLMGKSEDGDKTGKVPFSLFKYQTESLLHIHEKRDVIILKARQLGLSWTVAGYALWLAMFHKYQRILIISINDTESQVFLEKVKFIFDNLPEWMKVSVYKRNESVLWFGIRKGYDSDEVGGINSKIESIPTSKNAGTSRSLNLLIIDEAAKVEFIDAIYKSALPALASTGGKCVMLSTMTIEATGEFFEEMWHTSVEKKTSFFPFFIPFNRYPGHTDKWLEDQLSRMPASKRARAKQEHPRTPEEAFQIAGGRYFSVQTLEEHHKVRLKTPKYVGYLIETDAGVEFREDENGTVAVFQVPEPNEEYVVGADPAEGVEQDNTVCAVVRKRDFAVVARFISNITSPDEAARVARRLAIWYNNGMVAAENNNTHGGMMNLELKNNYWNLYYHEVVDRDSAPPVKRWGFRTDGQNRTWIVDHLDKLIRNQNIQINDAILYDELKEWIVDPKSGRGDHKKGRHDDYIFAVAIACWVIRENPWFDRKKSQEAREKSKTKRPKGGY
jgi:hypothetical protein